MSLPAGGTVIVADADSEAKGQARRFWAGHDLYRDDSRNAWTFLSHPWRMIVLMLPETPATRWVASVRTSGGHGLSDLADLDGPFLVLVRIIELPVRQGP